MPPARPASAEQAALLAPTSRLGLPDGALA